MSDIIALISLTRYGQALDRCNQALEFYADNAEFWFIKALILILSKSNDEGEIQKCIDKCIELNPTVAAELFADFQKKFGEPIKEDNVEISNNIFVVHGQDEEMKQAVARTLEKMNITPIILHEQPNEGRTVIEKFTDYSDVSFAVVILSPDDFGYSKKQTHENAKLRARQNVIFELGFFIGKLGRNRVFILKKEEMDFEMPSDYNGVVYTSYDKSGKWILELVRELNTCGYQVDATKLI